MKDVYFVNKNTGELLPGTEAIKRFYSEEGHGILERWTDEWQETEQEAENDLALPNFGRTIK